MRRSIVAVILVMLAAIVLQPSAVMARHDPDTLTAKDVRALVQQFGPLVSFHPDEEFFLDTPEAVLSGGTELAWGAVSVTTNPLTGDPMFVTVAEHGRVTTSADTLLDDVAAALPEPGDRFWLDIPDSLYGGHLQRAKAYVVVAEREGFLDLDFWFFYPNNGAISARVNILPVGPISLDPIGHHEGDWERVTVRLDGASGAWALHSVYLSQHSGGAWLEADDPQLEMDGDRPVVYTAIDSHAFYSVPGEFTYRTLPVAPGVVVSFVDRTVAGGAAFDASQRGNYRVVYSELAGLTVPSSPGWLFYESRWGPYEQQVFVSPYPQLPLTYPYVGSGPVGPLQH